MSASNPMHHDKPTCPCKTCGEATTETATKQCRPCWEVESRLVAYLQRGGENAKIFIATAMAYVARVE